MKHLPDNLRGAIFMIAAMAGFALEDTFLKAASVDLPAGQVIILFGCVGVIGFSLLARSRGEAVFDPLMLHPRMRWRALAESGGRIFYMLALVFTPLSNASAILQATPLVVVAGAALFMGEQVGWRRWTAIFVGFAGVLMILRPGPAGFEAASLLAVLGMLGFAARDLATRAAPRGLSNAQLGICGFSVLIPTGALLLVIMGQTPAMDLWAFARVGAGALFGIAAYSALTEAMRTGEVSVVTPFRYTRLLFGVGLGMVVFSERPDAMTLLGSAVILAAGLYTMLSERSRRR